MTDRNRPLPPAADGAAPGAGCRRPGTDDSHATLKVAWFAVLVAVVSLLLLTFGYQVGKDLAERENRRDCAAAGRLDCG